MNEIPQGIQGGSTKKASAEIQPETQTGYEFFTPEQKAELKKLAEERGAAAAAAEAMGMLDA